MTQSETGLSIVTDQNYVTVEMHTGHGKEDIVPSDRLSHDVKARLAMRSAKCDQRIYWLLAR